MLLATVLALAVLGGSVQHAAAVTTLPTVQTDQLMGIRTYTYLIAAPAEGLNNSSSSSSNTVYELRVYLRAACDSSGAKVLLRGFAGAFPIEGSAPTGLSLFSPHFQPPSLQQYQLQVISSSSSSSPSTANTSSTPTTTLKWFGPSNQGLWRFEGKVSKPSGRELLTLQGSSHTHQLPLSCDSKHSKESTLGSSLKGLNGAGLGSSLALGRPQPTPLPPTGLWNVITTTSANSLTPETLAQLLVLHMQYHERLGFNGTILRCNKGEAQALSVLPHIEALATQRKLIIWPWVHEHSLGHTPFYWQKPRNQLTLLAAYGTAVKLTFFDLDEYLVLPQGGTLFGGKNGNSSSSSSCMGRPLLGEDSSVPALSFARYSVRSCSDKRTDLQCWLQDGQALPTASKPMGLLIEKCPCQFHKPLVEADKTLTLSVHYVWAWGAKVVDVPQRCGFLMHLHALVQRRGHFMPPGVEQDHLLRAQWVLPESGGSGRVFVAGSSSSSDDDDDISRHLHSAAHCGELRKARLSDRPGQRAKFSMC